ncbi:hypothetical protein BCR35DRAFT_336944 [Leucosporidium creatinivorum]|uniref:DUF4042 domain-containing protein n=1 Tax=Leucosporidium creatinivorum TaxID=106004 RepID=A0A1Y2G3Y0_9BASI|nr:hypothetical protein BCR35DRAFT_336944 [Leucosporidium creatinivorum]
MWASSLKGSSCSTRTLEAYDRVLQGVTPLLLDPSLPLRIQAAGCLLQYSSTGTSAVLRKHILSITSTISKALAPFQYTTQHSPSGLGSLRFVSTCFRVLSALLGKLSPLPPEAVTSSVALLGTWVYHRPGLAGSASPAPDRGRVTPSGGALAFGVMGGFLPTSPQKKSTRSMSRSSSRSSLSGWGSESEEDEGQVEKRQGSVQVRLDALSCLRTLAINDPKLLYTQWNLFLADSPYLRHRPSLINLVESDPSSSVRLRACAALDAMLSESAPYLAIAEDRPTKASFTSLSSRLGEVVSELHLKLASLISSPASSRHPEFLLALLRLAKTLGDNSPYSRMSRPLAQPLASVVLPLLKARDPQYAIAAASAVASIAQNALSQPSAGKPLLNAAEIAYQSLSILQGPSDPELDVEAWTLLGTTASRAEGFDLSDGLHRLALQAARSSDASRPISRPITSALPPTLRHEPITSQALKLVGDDEASVRAAASRALGLLVKTSLFDSELLATIIDSIMRLCKEEDPVRSTASWSLANSCDVLTPNNSTSIDLGSLLSSSLALASSAHGEKIQANALRAIGSTLKVASPTSSLAIETTRLEEAVASLCEGLKSGPAKVRWNAASAITNALLSPLLTSPTSPPPILALALPSLLLLALSSTLSSSACPNYKVRIQATSGLLVARKEMFGSGEQGAEAFEMVRGRVGEGLREVKGEEEGVAVKERVHWSQLVLKLERCTKHLESLAVAEDVEVATRELSIS